jgi:hypothetical protein
MDDTGSRADRIRTRQRALIVERGFEMERVEQKLLATAYESVCSTGREACDRFGAASSDGGDLATGAWRREAARRIGRGVGSDALMAMGG